MNIFRLGRNPDPADMVIDGERGVTSVNKGLNIQAKITNLAIMAAVVVLVGGLLVKYYAAEFDKRAEGRAAQKEAVHTAASPDLPPLVPPVFPEAPAAKPAALPPMTPPPAGATGATAPPPSPAQQLLERRLSSPLSFKTGGALAAEVPALAGIPDAALIPGKLAAGVSGNTDPLSRSLQASTFAGARAYLLPEPGMMITRGTVIPCTVLPALNTTLPGIITCIQSTDVRGADGKVVLLERGTKWVGQQQAGMAQGQNRVGILWARGETPHHVLVDVDSGGADALGRPGIDGAVDHHFWERFGAAIMLSLISDIGPYLTATRQSGGNNNTTIAFPSVAGGAQSVMSEVLKSTLDIAPTLNRDQGAEIVIYVARDLDFRDVYALQESTK